MPQALQVINAFSQSLTGGAFEALTPGTGDSFQVQNVPQTAPAYLSEIWGVDLEHAFELSVKASRFHDQQFGIRMQASSGALTAPVGRSELLLPPGQPQLLYPSDNMFFNVNGTASDKVNVTALIYYTDLPGIAARLASAPYVKANNKYQVGINVPLTTGAGDWGATAALNSADDRLHAEADYAVLGFTSNLPCACVALSGIDTGNMRVGGPVLGDAEHDASLFYDWAIRYQAPLIPVINANNAGSILLQAADVTSKSIQIDVMLQELPSRFTS